MILRSCSIAVFLAGLRWAAAAAAGVGGEGVRGLTGTGADAGPIADTVSNRVP